MRGEQLARQWRILRAIESRNHGVTVAELAAQEGSHIRASQLVRSRKGRNGSRIKELTREKS